MRRPDLPLVGGTGCVAAAGAAGRPSMLAQPPARRRAHHVLLPVPAPGRPVLHGPAVPVGRARPRARSTPACACCRSRSRSCSPRSASPSSGPHASPRARRARRGSLLCSPASCSLIAALEVGAGPEIVTVPLLLAGLGVGALASQLGAVTVSAVPDEQSGEVGGLQNTVTNLGASLGHGARRLGPDRRAHRVVPRGHPGQPRRPRRGRVDGRRSSSPPACPSSPTPSSTDALDDAGVPQDQADAIVDANDVDARIDGAATEPHRSRRHRRARDLLHPAAAQAARGQHRLVATK